MTTIYYKTYTSHATGHSANDHMAEYVIKFDGWEVGTLLGFGCYENNDNVAFIMESKGQRKVIAVLVENIQGMQPNNMSEDE